jgi:dipeptidyl aminopeptidase/acylaminoacyl peptidase
MLRYDNHSTNNHYYNYYDNNHNCWPRNNNYCWTNNHINSNDNNSRSLLCILLALYYLRSSIYRH